MILVKLMQYSLQPLALTTASSSHTPQCKPPSPAFGASLLGSILVMHLKQTVPTAATSLSLPFRWPHRLCMPLCGLPSDPAAKPKLREGWLSEEYL
jgi:hypothetical protein